MSLPEVHLIGGTRPEAVKLAPVALAMSAAGLVTPVLVASGQHPAMVSQALAAFDLTADVTLQVERGTGSQAELLTEMIRQLDTLWARRTRLSSSSHASLTIRSVSEPTSRAQPACSDSTRSVTSRSTSAGTPKDGASSWMPPESVSTR